MLEAALSACLEHIERPALVARTDLSIISHNRLALPLLDGRLAETRDALRDARSDGDDAWRCFPLSHTHLLFVRYAPPGRAWRLTERETGVLDLLVQGEANKTIATRLGCSERTVEVHVSRILDKTGCSSRAQLIALWWRAGTATP